MRYQDANLKASELRSIIEKHFPYDRRAEKRKYGMTSSSVSSNPIIS